MKHGSRGAEAWANPMADDRASRRGGCVSDPYGPCTPFEERAAIIQEACQVSKTEAERMARVQLGMLDGATQQTLLKETRTHEKQ